MTGPPTDVGAPAGVGPGAPGAHGTPAMAAATATGADTVTTEVPGGAEAATAAGGDAVTTEMPAGGDTVTTEMPAGGDTVTTEVPVGVPSSGGVGVWHLVDVVDVAMILPSPHPEVVLQEREAPFRVVRVPVALADGTAIAHAWRKATTPRPLTHELFVEVLGRHQVVVEAVRVTAVESGTFHAELDTTGRSGRQVVPCRTSDALALALRHRPSVPILVAEWVLAEQSTAPA